jgi:hypothetical protein
MTYEEAMNEISFAPPGDAVRVAETRKQWGRRQQELKLAAKAQAARDMRELLAEMDNRRDNL